MDIADWNQLFSTCSNYDDLINFVIKYTPQILNQNLLTFNYIDNNFILSPSVTIDKYYEKQEAIPKRTFNNITGEHLFQKHVKRPSLPINKIKITNNKYSDIIVLSPFIKPFYNKISFSLDLVLLNLTYRKHFIKYFLQLFIMSDKLKLKDFDLKQIKINKEHETATINNIDIQIRYITSIELKEYCLKQIYSDDKTICKRIIDTILLLNENSIIYSGLYENTFRTFQNYYVKIDINLYNILKFEESKYLIIKYIFSKYNNLTELQDIKEIFKIFESGIETQHNFLELVKQMIITNNPNMLEFILKNKPHKIQQSDYDILKTYASDLKLFHMIKILCTFETIDLFGF
jgi:hypothetical protein